MDRDIVEQAQRGDLDAFANGPFQASAEIYDPKNGTFSATAPMADTLASHTATLLPDGRVPIAGGFDGRADVDTAEIYDPKTGNFTAAGKGS